MEVSNGVVWKSLPCCYSGARKEIKTHIAKSSTSHVYFRRLPDFKNCGFEDRGHLEYYMVSPVCGDRKGKKGWKGVSTEKRMKLLKGLSKDLLTFSDLGFGLGFDSSQGLVGDDNDDKTKIISQAAEILIAQLKKLRAEEEKLKKREKEEKEKSKTNDCESSSSSSSSSESSDSECDEVVDMNHLRDKAAVQPIETKETELSNLKYDPMSEQKSPNLEQKCCNMILEATLNKGACIEAISEETLSLNLTNVGSIGNSISTTPPRKRIEVCTGGKCKKLGGLVLMEEFQKVMGHDGEVVGCKCMGKCRSAPNVRVLNDIVGENIGDDDSLRTPTNPLFVGVGLDDVGSIVANYFGEQLGLGLAVASASS